MKLYKDNNAKKALEELEKLMIKNKDVLIRLKEI